MLGGFSPEDGFIKSVRPDAHPRQTFFPLFLEFVVPVIMFGINYLTWGSGVLASPLQREGFSFSEKTFVSIKVFMILKYNFSF